MRFGEKSARSIRQKEISFNKVLLLRILMNKQDITSDFKIYDIHKIREYNSEYLNNLPIEEQAFQRVRLFFFR